MASPGVRPGNSKGSSWIIRMVYRFNCVCNLGYLISICLIVIITALEPNDGIRAVYSRPFKLVYNVVLGERQLSSVLRVENTSKQADTLEFQALLHNYIHAPADEVRITPLKGLAYYDKTESTDDGRAAPKIETREEVTVSEYTDSVYEDGPLKYNVSWPDWFLNINVKNFKDVVVWNPQQEGRKIGDMEPEGW